MAFRSRLDLTAVDRTVGFINNTANKVSCNFCHKEFLTENKLTCAREHVRKHVLRGLITLDEAAENSMGNSRLLQDVEASKFKGYSLTTDNDSANQKHDFVRLFNS
jgi:hypothetical protein